MTERWSMTGLTIHTEERVIQEGSVVIQGKNIEAVQSTSPGIPSPMKFPSHWHLIPGMVNIHMHGILGADTLDGNIDAFKKMSASLSPYGVTGFLASTMTTPIPKIEKALSAAHAYLKKESSPGAALLGIHLEGPFISKQALGVQKANDVLKPDIILFKKWQKISGNQIKIVTLAPEEDFDLKLVHYLISQKIVASIGHSEATYEQTEQAIDAGCTLATHLFNAMHPIHHRNPGCVTALLNDPRVFTEIIVDGIHLHPGIIQLVKKAKGIDRIILITDGLLVTGLPPGTYSIDGQVVEFRNNEARLTNGTLAGSVLTMDQALRNFMRMTGCSLQEAIKPIAENPAKCLGLFESIGSIQEGKNADFAILDEKFQVKMTVQKGMITYRSPELLHNLLMEGT